MNCVSPSFFLHVFFHLFFYILIYISVRMKKTYSEADIDAAVELFQTTDNSLSQCAKIHGIPRMTLIDRIKGKHKSRKQWKVLMIHWMICLNQSQL